jgi:hypothetical protein
MAVPNRNDFSLQDVQAEVDPSKNNLSDFISVANGQSTSKWDSNYSGSKNSLLNFRNYGATGSSLTSFSSSLGFLSSQNDACNAVSTSETYYHDGASGLPNTGDYVFTSSGGGTPLGVGYYKFSGPSTYEIGSSGLVIDISTC